MRTAILFVALFMVNLLSAQQADSVATRIDSLHLRTPILSEHVNAAPAKFKIRALIIPATFISYGFVALNNHALNKLNNNTKTELQEDYPRFYTKTDNYLQYAPVLMVYGLNAAGIKGKNNFRDRTIIFTLSTLMSAAFVLPLKNITKVQRPDGSGFNSFPSGHTTTAFAAAEFLRQEYQDVSPWYAVAGYAMATATGVLRVYNNKHWVNDVVAGAGFGMLSTRIAYWIYPAIKRILFKNKPVSTMLVPYYEGSSGGLSVVYNFNH